MPLLVDAYGVDGLEIKVEEKLQTDHLGIIPDAHGLGKSCLVGTYLLIRRVLDDAVGIAHFGFHHSLYLLEVMLCAPEAASRQIDFFF